MYDYDILIIGAGAAGLSAAVSAYNAGCRSIAVVDQKDKPGGILIQCMHDGFGNSVTGPEYVGNIIEEFNETEAELILSACVLSVTKEREAFVSTRDGLRKITFNRLILACGCEEISPGRLNISGTRPDGIYTAGQAQEMINLMNRDIGDDIVILGCGDLGMIMARTFVQNGKNVVAVVEKESSHGGMPKNYRECIEKYGIPVIFNETITEISGREHVSSVRLSSGETLKCSTLVIAAGMKPDDSLIEDIADCRWVYRCGNCYEVHDMVESAVIQSVKTGAEVAGEVLSER